MASLVDLSLFASSPTGDQFSYYDESPFFPSIGYTSTSPAPNPVMKPLPPIPQRRSGALIPGPARSLFERVKHRRLESCQESTTRNQQPTLRQRRNLSAPNQALSIPTTTSYAQLAAPAPASRSACPTPKSAAPMIWLADEEMWLVECTEVQQEVYSDHAPAPRTNPGPYGWYAPENEHEQYEDSPPAYSRSETSTPSPIALSPVQSQFLRLFEARNEQAVPNSTSTIAPHAYRSEINTSPMFQEAISGLGLYYEEEMAPQKSKASAREEELVSSVSRDTPVRAPIRSNNTTSTSQLFMGSRESWHSEGVSPLSSTGTTPSRWGVQRSASERYPTRCY